MFRVVDKAGSFSMVHCFEQFNEQKTPKTYHRFKILSSRRTAGTGSVSKGSVSWKHAMSVFLGQAAMTSGGFPSSCSSSVGFLFLNPEKSGWKSSAALFSNRERTNDPQSMTMG